MPNFMGLLVSGAGYWWAESHWPGSTNSPLYFLIMFPIICAVIVLYQADIER